LLVMVSNDSQQRQSATKHHGQFSSGVDLGPCLGEPCLIWWFGVFCCAPWPAASTARAPGGVSTLAFRSIGLPAARNNAVGYTWNDGCAHAARPSNAKRPSDQPSGTGALACVGGGRSACSCWPETRALTGRVGVVGVVVVVDVVDVLDAVGVFGSVSRNVAQLEAIAGAL
jgi:hypothetical protein